MTRGNLRMDGTSRCAQPRLQHSDAENLGPHPPTGLDICRKSPSVYSSARTCPALYRPRGIPAEWDHVSEGVEGLERATAEGAGFAGMPAAEERVDHDAVARVHEVADGCRNYPTGIRVRRPMIKRRTDCTAAYDSPRTIIKTSRADGGRATRDGKEAVADLARMIGWDTHLGHLCGGGTMANLEALWVAAQLHPGATILASTQAHYTHKRIAGLLGQPFETLPCDRRGRLDGAALERRLAAGGVEPCPRSHHPRRRGGSLVLVHGAALATISACPRRAYGATFSWREPRAQGRGGRMTG